MWLAAWHHYFPLALPFLILLGILLALVVFFIEVGVLGYAYGRLGIHRRSVYALLLASLLGSYINIPVAELPAKEVISGQIVTYFGVQHVIPVFEDLPKTVIAVNVGGAVIPTLLSIYLALKNRLYLRAVLGVAVVTAIAHMLAAPVRGVGIAMPIFVAPIAAAGVGLLLARRQAAPLAYISGSLGTLLGADVLNLGRIQGLDAPIASIGGAGTFDGIFMTGILAVLLASLLSPRTRRRVATPG